MQRKTHSAMLAGFDSELEALAEVDLLPAACSLGQTKLLHLVNASKLRAWASECHTCHTNLAKKVHSKTKDVGHCLHTQSGVLLCGSKM